MLWGNSGKLTYSAIVSPLRKMIFQEFNQAILLNISNTNFWKPWIFYDVFGSINETENRFSQTINGAIYEWTCQYFCLPSYCFHDPNLSQITHIWYLGILVTFTRTLITSEPFELGSNARPFWNPEKKCHTEILIARF